MSSGVARNMTARAHELARDLGFTESPVWTKDHRLVVASVNRGLVYEIALSGGVPRILAEPGGGPNGLIAYGSDLLVCQNGGTAMASKSSLRPPPSVQRVHADGSVSVIRSADVSAPSDGVLGSDGRLWFTDPTSHAVDEAATLGRVLALDLFSGELETINAGILFPNGICFGPTDDLLHVAESAADRVRQLRRQRDGGWSLAPATGTRLPGVPDGLACDIEGCVWVACSFSGQLARLWPDGSLRDVVDLGAAIPTAVCFAGRDLDMLIVTSARGGSVIAMPAPAPGLPPPDVR